MRYGNFLFGGTTLLLAGWCSAAIQVVSLSDDQIRQLEDNVPVYSSEEFVTESSVKGVAIGYSCRMNFGDPEVSQETAMTQMRYQATQQGGNAISGYSCSAPIYGDQSTGCIRYIQCKGNIVKLDTAPHRASLQDKMADRQQLDRNSQQVSSSAENDVSARAEAWANYYNETITKARSGKAKPLILLTCTQN